MNAEINEADAADEAAVMDAETETGKSNGVAWSELFWGRGAEGKYCRDDLEAAIWLFQGALLKGAVSPEREMEKCLRVGELWVRDAGGDPLAGAGVARVPRVWRSPSTAVPEPVVKMAKLEPKAAAAPKVAAVHWERDGEPACHASGPGGRLEGVSLSADRKVVTCGNCARRMAREPLPAAAQLAGGDVQAPAQKPAAAAARPARAVVREWEAGDDRPCRICGEVLPEGDFASDTNNWDGRRRSCKPCDRRVRREREAARKGQAA